MKFAPCYVFCLGMYPGYWMILRTGCEVDA